jgi:hypothetical protein
VIVEIHPEWRGFLYSSSDDHIVEKGSLKIVAGSMSSCDAFYLGRPQWLPAQFRFDARASTRTSWRWNTMCKHEQEDRAGDQADVCGQAIRLAQRHRSPSTAPCNWLK